MEKILLAVDAINPDKKALEFACYLGRLTKSKVTGVFLENLVDEERFVLRQSHGIACLGACMGMELVEDSDEYKAKVELINRNIAFFKEACITRDVSFNVHRDRGVPAIELINESRFADLLVVDAETTFIKQYEGTPTEFIKNILKKAECPVIVAPERVDAIEEIIFTYNSTFSSIFAIKQFTYLLPQLKDKKLTIMTMNEEGEWRDRDKYKFKEWLKDHYTDLHFEALKGSTDIELLDYLFKRKNMFLIMGAYGRDALSQFFKRSYAEVLIKTITQPIFIAHI